MHKIHLPAILFLLLQFSFTSCEIHHEVAPLIEEVVPLKVGNEWIYKVTDYDTNGKLITSSFYKNTVLRDTVIHNSTWYILSNRYIVQNSPEGYVHYNRSGSESIIIYQSSSQGGVGYMYNYPTYDLWVMTTRSQETEAVSVPSGIYPSNVFKIEKQYKSQDGNNVNSINQHDYVSQGVGLVRTDLFYVDSEKVR